ncbi:MAG: hypothetical protein LBQ31_04130 [Bacteroidales bacterium]|nr:hypothetical protein [Bacteroidales bacterium]
MLKCDFSIDNRILVKIRTCYKSIPCQLAKENHKFQYTVVAVQLKSLRLGKVGRGGADERRGRGVTKLAEKVKIF